MEEANLSLNGERRRTEETEKVHSCHKCNAAAHFVTSNLFKSFQVNKQDANSLTYCWMVTNPEKSWIRASVSGKTAQFDCFSVTPDGLEELCIMTDGRFEGLRGGYVSSKPVRIPIGAIPKLHGRASVEWDVCLTGHFTCYTQHRILKGLNCI